MGFSPLTRAKTEENNGFRTRPYRMFSQPGGLWASSETHSVENPQLKADKGELLMQESIARLSTPR